MTFSTKSIELCCVGGVLGASQISGDERCFLTRCRLSLAKKSPFDASFVLLTTSCIFFARDPRLQTLLGCWRGNISFAFLLLTSSSSPATIPARSRPLNSSEFTPCIAFDIPCPSPWLSLSENRRWRGGVSGFLVSVPAPSFLHSPAVHPLFLHCTHPLLVTPMIHTPLSAFGLANSSL